MVAELFKTTDLFNFLLGIIQVLVTGFVAYKIAGLEKNTNSIKDALIKETQESFLAKGVLQQKEHQYALDAEIKRKGA